MTTVTQEKQMRQRRQTMPCDQEDCN